MKKYGGKLVRNKPHRTKEEEFNGRKNSIRVDIPPLGAIYIKKK